MAEAAAMKTTTEAAVEASSHSAAHATVEPSASSARAGERQPAGGHENCRRQRGAPGGTE